MHAPDAVREPVAKRHRPSGLTVFVSAFVAGAVVSFGINHFVDAQLAQNRPQVECEPIFVALRSLPQGAPVTVWDVALKDWPLAMLPTSALRAEDSFEGTVLRYPLREGQPLLAVQLVKAPTDHSALAADIETFKQPTPAATRQAPVAESDSWLPATKTTSVDVTPFSVAAAATEAIPEAIPEAVAETVAEAVAEAIREDLRDDTAGDDASSLPLVDIAATPSDTAADFSMPATDEPSPLAVVEVATDATPVMATPPGDVLPLIEEPRAGIIATDEPRPFVAARQPRPPIAPQPRLDIADSIAALTRARNSAPVGSSREVSSDAPVTSVLVAQPETRDAEPTLPEPAFAEPTSAEPSAADLVGVEPGPTAPSATAPVDESRGAANTEAAAGTAEQSTGTPQADGALARIDVPPMPDEGVSVPLPTPRYLVIPERIALEADSFFGPTPTEVGLTTIEAESTRETSAQPAAGTQAGTASKSRVQYEQPPVTNPPPPTLGEMFPNIANGIDALSGPFRGRSAQQPRRTR